MKTSHARLLAITALILGGLATAAASQPPRKPSPAAKPASALSAPKPIGPDGDYPTLAERGSYTVGVTRLDVTNPDQPDLTSPAQGGVAPRHDRVLPLTIWYPATKPAKGKPAHFAEHVPGPVTTGGQVWTSFANAAPIRRQNFPLVVFSHGFTNWATGYVDLAENLASKGYVVGVIDHRDDLTASGARGANSFPMVQFSRSADQRFVINEMARRAGSGPLAGTYDPTNIALIGYSMGGYGAMITAGAGLDPNAGNVRSSPALMGQYAEGSPLMRQGPPAGLKAVVAMAPWGATGQRAWRDSGMAQVKLPFLIIVGDHDDVSGIVGVKWIYDHLVNADRRMLVYQNAHHNIAGDGEGSIPERDFSNIERFEEPVWRRDRILAINRHFITAFLDSTLKGDAAHGAYLNVPTVKAEDGVWPQVRGPPPAADLRASPTDPNARGFWPGFQRRWAIGLELHHDAPKP